MIHLQIGLSEVNNALARRTGFSGERLWVTLRPMRSKKQEGGITGG
jgi:hypothetical protein